MKYPIQVPRVSRVHVPWALQRTKRILTSSLFLHTLGTTTLRADSRKDVQLYTLGETRTLDRKGRTMEMPGRFKSGPHTYEPWTSTESPRYGGRVLSTTTMGHILRIGP